MGQEFEYTVRAKGRLDSPDEFSNIILRTCEDSSVVRVSDVGRVELGAYNYGTGSRLNSTPGSLLVIYQLPGANAMATAAEILKTTMELSKTFPQGITYQVTYLPVAGSRYPTRRCTLG